MNEKDLFADRGGTVGESELQKEVFIGFRVEAEKNLQAVQKYCLEVSGRCPDVSLIFYSTKGMGAACRKKGDKYYIGMSIGLPDLLDEIFRDAIIWISGAGRELEGEAYRPQEGKAWVDPVISELIVQDAVRQALMFIFHHELGHIINGHLDLMLTNSAGQFEGFAAQCLELDADSEAVSRSLNRMIGTINRYKRTPMEFISTPRMMLFFWGVIHYAMFREFATQGYIFEHLPELSHTPPQLRALQASHNLEACLEGRKIGASKIPFCNTASEILSELSALPQAIRAVEYWHGARFGEMWSTPAKQAVGEEANRFYFLEMPNAWAEMRPMLLPHAYGLLAEK